MRQVGGMLLLLASAALYGFWARTTSWHVLTVFLIGLVFGFLWVALYLYLDDLRWKQVLR